MNQDEWEKYRRENHKVSSCEVGEGPPGPGGPVFSQKPSRLGSFLLILSTFLGISLGIAVFPHKEAPIPVPIERDAIAEREKMERQILRDLQIELRDYPELVEIIDEILAIGEESR